MGDTLDQLVIRGIDAQESKRRRRVVFLRPSRDRAIENLVGFIIVIFLVWWLRSQPALAIAAVLGPALFAFFEHRSYRLASMRAQASPHDLRTAALRCARELSWESVVDDPEYAILRTPFGSMVSVIYSPDEYLVHSMPMSWHRWPFWRVAEDRDNLRDFDLLSHRHLRSIAA